jgi:hypothetical protein
VVVEAVMVTLALVQQLLAVVEVLVDFVQP